MASWNMIYLYYYHECAAPCYHPYDAITMMAYYGDNNNNNNNNYYGDGNANAERDGVVTLKKMDEVT